MGGGARQSSAMDRPRITIVIATLLAVAGAVATANVTAGLLTLALASYQGIVQLAPALYLGIFWRRGNAAGAASGMVAGFAVAVVLQFLYPVSIPALAGMTSGVVGLIVNTLVYVALSYALPQNEAERRRIGRLFDGAAEEAGDDLPAGKAQPRPI